MSTFESTGQRTFTLSEAELQRLVELVQQNCADLAEERHTDALIDGLCAEGAWACAVDAIRSQSSAQVLQSFLADHISKR